MIDFDEFVEAMASQQEDDETSRQLQELQDVFSLFDSDGSGLLSADEVRGMAGQPAAVLHLRASSG